MKIFNAIAVTAVIGASFMSVTPAEAFWGGKAAEQRKMILGTWDCTYEIDGKIYRPEMLQFSFRRDGGVRTVSKIGSGQMQLMGSWKINKESELIFPAGGISEMKDLRTRTTKVEPINVTNYSDILTLSNSGMIFEREGSGVVYSCRKQSHAGKPDAHNTGAESNTNPKGKSWGR